MALYGKSNVVDALRATKLVFWRIYEGTAQKGSGAFFASSDFENPQLGEKDSYDDLTAALNRLTPGRYILLAYRTNSTKGGSAFESSIEIEGSAGSSSAISGIKQSFFLDGIGEITPENFESAIEKKMQNMLQKKKEAEDLAALKAENQRLKDEVKENESGLKRGLLSIGAVLYPMVSKTPAFKDVIGLVGNVMAGAQKEAPAQQLGAASNNTSLPENHIEGDQCQIGNSMVDQQQLFSTLDDLGTNNPDVLKHLQILAKLKKDNPSMYQEAVAMAESF